MKKHTVQFNNNNIANRLSHDNWNNNNIVIYRKMMREVDEKLIINE